MPLEAGRQLGPYEIVSAIGAGGMGEVYKARDTRLDRTVAIKVLPEHVASDPDLKQRFEREAKTISSLNHPHICTLYDIGTQDGIDFLVMEYLDGETLAQRLEKGALPLDQALTVAIEIADALDKAHRQGIVHRDIKPSNVMLTESGAKVLDFGIAVRFGAADLDTVTRFHSRDERPRFSSPARCRTWLPKCWVVSRRMSGQTSGAWVCCCMRGGPQPHGPFVREDRCQRDVGDLARPARTAAFISSAGGVWHRPAVSRKRTPGAVTNVRAR